MQKLKNLRWGPKVAAWGRALREWLIVQKLIGWFFERFLTVAVIWTLVSVAMWFALHFVVPAHHDANAHSAASSVAASDVAKTDKPSILSAEAEADIADPRLLVYLMAAYLLFIVSGAFWQQVVKTKQRDQELFRTFGNHILDELSSASTHAALAYLLSVVIVAQRSLSAHQTYVILAFCAGGIGGFRVSNDDERQHGEPDHTRAKELGLKIDGLVKNSIVSEYTTITGTLAKLPSPGYHLWALRFWGQLANRREFYPEMELTLKTEYNVWDEEAENGAEGVEEVHTWQAPDFHFGGEKGHVRAFEIIMVNETDHKKLQQSVALAGQWNKLREKAGEKFNAYPTPPMRWDQIRSERCAYVKVQREK